MVETWVNLTNSDRALLRSCGIEPPAEMIYLGKSESAGKLDIMLIFAPEWRRALAQLERQILSAFQIREDWKP